MMTRNVLGELVSHIPSPIAGGNVVVTVGNERARQAHLDGPDDVP
jgi:hypothetical protein